MTDFDHATFLTSIAPMPGIYCMYDRTGTIIYIGKAKNLKARLSSYFHSPATAKTQVLLKHLSHIETTITHTEKEALLLEYTLIKKHRPRYNIVLRDDKSYPYLYLNTDHDFPRLVLYRGNKEKKGDYFGPYPHLQSVYQTLEVLQKLFKLRNCRDSFFKHRSRPCLQYQIKRCKAPCVGFITREEYQQDVEYTRLFLRGKSQDVVKNIQQKMEAAAQQLDFEKAAVYRDFITQLAQISQQQSVIVDNAENVDVLGFAQTMGLNCISVLMFRQGKLLATAYEFLKQQALADPEEMLTAFIKHYYLNSQSIPPHIILPWPISEQGLLSTGFSDLAERQINIKTKVRGVAKQWLKLAEQNAAQMLTSHLQKTNHHAQQFAVLQDLLALPHPLKNIECFDISHTQGEATVASCVVFDQQGPRKNDYRHFNIKDIQAADDYAAMYQVLERRYFSMLPDHFPDLVIVDGGKGQLRQAQKILNELLPGFKGKKTIALLGIAKGPTRRPGLEKFYHFIQDKMLEVNLNEHPDLIHLLQYIRDEAHRFAITRHRERRQKIRNTSVLDQIDGIGPRKRRLLLNYFGGLQGLKKASIEDLSKVPGLGKKLAAEIFEFLQTL